MYSLRRLLYYLRSIGTLLAGVRNWPVLFGLLGKEPKPVALMLRDGTRYRVDSLMGAWVVKETNLDRDYERYGVPIEDGWNVVDVGAGLGDFTIFAARRTPHGRVYAYEPAPDSVELLRHNLELNRIHNVTLFPYAVGSRRGALTLDISGGIAVQYRTTAAGQAQATATGKSLVPQAPQSAPGAAQAQPAGGKITVRCVALNDLLADLPGGVCDFLKMDCEGAEYDILLNTAEATLAQMRRMCLEYHDYPGKPAHDELVRFLEGRGWRVRVYPSLVHRELGFLYAEQP